MNINKETLTEGNVLIAKFLGWRLDDTFPDKGRVWRSPKNDIELDTTLKFHTSFDYLIPLAHEIIRFANKHMGDRVFQKSSYTGIYIHEMSDKGLLWDGIVKRLKIIDRFQSYKNLEAAMNTPAKGG